MGDVENVVRISSLGHGRTLPGSRPELQGPGPSPGRPAAGKVPEYQCSDSEFSNPSQLADHVGSLSLGYQNCATQASSDPGGLDSNYYPWEYSPFESSSRRQMIRWPGRQMIGWARATCHRRPGSCAGPQRSRLFQADSDSSTGARAGCHRRRDSSGPGRLLRLRLRVASDSPRRQTAPATVTAGSLSCRSQVLSSSSERRTIMMGSEFRPWAGSSELGLEGGSTQGRRRGLLRRLSAPPAAGQPERLRNL